MRRLLLVVAALAVALGVCRRGDRRPRRRSRRSPATRRGHRGGPRAPLRPSARRHRLQPPDLGGQRARRSRRALGARAAGPADPRPGRAPPHAARPHGPSARRRRAAASSASRFTPTSPPTGACSCTGATSAGDTRVGEFRDGKLVRELLHVDQPEENHNGGQLIFGPDARLYLGLGDGGGAFDPDEHAQDPRSQARQAAVGRRRRAAPRLARRAHRPAQPVALRVRPGARRGLDRRRRPGRRRGGQPRAAGARRAAEEPRLGRVRGRSADRGRRLRARPHRRARLARRHLYAPGRVLGDRRVRVPGHGARVAAGALPVRRLLLRCGVVARRHTGGRSRRTSAASARRCRSSRTSAPTPTASPCSRPRRARSIAPFPPGASQSASAPAR